MQALVVAKVQWHRLIGITCLGLGLGLLVMAQGALAVSACAALTVDNAWVRVVPGAPVAAGYFEATNAGSATVTITAVSSPQFGRVHMHESTVADNGMASMKPVDAVAVAAGRTVSFAPGGYHLMMFDAKHELAPGDTVTLNIQCKGADTAHTVTAEVRNMMPSGSHHMKMGHQ